MECIITYNGNQTPLLPESMCTNTFVNVQRRFECIFNKLCAKSGLKIKNPTSITNSKFTIHQQKQLTLLPPTDQLQLPNLGLGTIPLLTKDRSMSSDSIPDIPDMNPSNKVVTTNGNSNHQNKQQPPITNQLLNNNMNIRQNNNTSFNASANINTTNQFNPLNVNISSGHFQLQQQVQSNSNNLLMNFGNNNMNINNINNYNNHQNNINGNVVYSNSHNNAYSSNNLISNQNVNINTNRNTNNNMNSSLNQPNHRLHNNYPFPIGGSNSRRFQSVNFSSCKKLIQNRNHLNQRINRRLKVQSHINNIKSSFNHSHTKQQKPTPTPTPTRLHKQTHTHPHVHAHVAAPAPIPISYSSRHHSQRNSVPLQTTPSAPIKPYSQTTIPKLPQTQISPNCFHYQIQHNNHLQRPLHNNRTHNVIFVPHHTTKHQHHYPQRRHINGHRMMNHNSNIMSNAPTFLPRPSSNLNKPNTNCRNIKPQPNDYRTVLKNYISETTTGEDETECKHCNSLNQHKQNKKLKYGEARLSEITNTTQSAIPSISSNKNKNINEYKSVSGRFLKFTNLSGLRNIEVVKVWKIRNDKLMDDYKWRKKSILRGLDHDISKLNEKCLYHGTNIHVIPKIITQGFLRQFTTRHAFGAGCYFALNPAYSAHPRYSTPNSEGLQFMFVCSVICGEYCRGNPRMKVPDCKPNTNNVLYETTVNDILKPTVFVTFQDNQAVPMYLIAFKNKDLKIIPN